jgi:hypothetical protein
MILLLAAAVELTAATAPARAAAPDPYAMARARAVAAGTVTAAAEPETNPPARTITARPTGAIGLPYGGSDRPYSTGVAFASSSAGGYGQSGNGAYSSTVGLGSGSPYLETREVPVAAAAAMHARVDLARARGTAKQVFDAARDQFESSPAYRQSSAALANAQQAYHVARDRVMQMVQQDPDYQAAMARSDAYAQMIARARREVPIDQAGIVEFSARKLEAGSAAGRIAAKALAADAETQRTRAEMLSANDELTRLRQSAEHDLYASTDWRSAQDALWDARSRAFTTDAYLNGTIVARNLSLRLAYHQINANSGALYSAMYSPNYPLYGPRIGGYYDGFAIGYPGWLVNR